MAIRLPKKGELTFAIHVQRLVEATHVIRHRLPHLADVRLILHEHIDPQGPQPGHMRLRVSDPLLEVGRLGIRIPDLRENPIHQVRYIVHHAHHTK